MKTQRVSQAVQPLANGANGNGKKSFPAWMIEAGFRGYTQYSNDVLEAHMAPGRPIKERIFAYCVRNAWGRHCDFVLAPSTTPAPAWQTEIVDALGILKSHVSEALSELEESGWIRTDGKVIYPQARPPIEPAAEAPAEPTLEELGLPDFDSWCAKQDPELTAKWESVLQQWNEVRKKRRARLLEYGQLAERLRAEKVPGTADGSGNEKFPVQTRDSAVPGTKGSVYNERILIEKKANKELASYEPPASQIDDLKKRIRELQDAGICSKLGPLSNTTAQNLLKHGTPEEIAGFLLGASRDHRNDHWQGWGLAVIETRDKLPAFRELLAGASAEPAAEDVDPQQNLESSIRTSISLTGEHWSDHPQYAEWVAELAELERQHPALVARIREQLKSEGAL